MILTCLAFDIDRDPVASITPRELLTWGPRSALGTDLNSSNTRRNRWL